MSTSSEAVQSQVREVDRVHRAARTCIRWALTALAGVSLLLLGFLAVGPHVLPYRTLTMLTGSMSPLFPAGSVVVATPEPASSLRVGQVLVYRIPVEDHRVVSHRVVEVTQTAKGLTVRTKGDANDAPDSWTAKLTDAQVYTAHFAVPKLGWVVRFLREPRVLFAVSHLIPAAALAWFILALWWPRDTAVPVQS